MILRDYDFFQKTTNTLIENIHNKSVVIIFHRKRYHRQVHSFVPVTSSLSLSVNNIREVNSVLDIITLSNF